LTTGNHTLTASYGGNGNCSASTSDAVVARIIPSDVLQIVAPTTLVTAIPRATYTQTFTATGGTLPYTWSLVSSGTQELAMTPDGVLSGTPTTTGSYSLTVRVQDSKSQDDTQVYTLTVRYPDAPPITLSVSAQPTSPSDQPIPQVTLGQAYPFPLTGTVKLSFAPYPPGLSAGFGEMQFLTGGGSFQINIPAGSTTPVPAPPPIQVGTVAGEITATLTSLTVASTNDAVTKPDQLPNVKIVVQMWAPEIVPGSVKITNLSSSGFDVVLDACSTPRDLSKADLVFTAASQTQLTGPQTFTMALDGIANAWFDPANATGIANGGSFSLKIPFNFSGDVNAIGSVSVTLTNSIGTSAPVGGR
jgi:hypothetical protein